MEAGAACGRLALVVAVGLLAAACTSTIEGAPIPATPAPAPTGAFAPLPDTSATTALVT